MKAIATIYGSGDEEQKAEIDFSFDVLGRLFAPSTYEITSAVILTPLSVSSGDLVTDVIQGISEALGVPDYMVRMECEVEEVVEKEMIFVGCSEPVPNYSWI